MKSLLLLFLLTPPQDEDRIGEFIENLAADDERSTLFRDALGSAYGRIVLKDRIGKAEEALRARARAQAVPNFFSEHFEEKDGRLHLRKERKDFSDNLTSDAKSYRSDINKVRDALKDLADRFAEDKDVNRDIKRFLEQPGSAHYFYSSRVRTQLRPGVAVYQRYLAAILVMDENGTIGIPESRLELAERVLGNANERMSIMQEIASELKSFTDELQGEEILTRAGRDILFAFALTRDVWRRGNAEELRRVADSFSDRLTVAGLKKALPQYREISKLADMIRPTGRRYADLIREEDDVHRGWKRMLREDVVIVSIAQRQGITYTDAGLAVKNYLLQFLEETDDGRVRANPTYEPQLVRGIKDAFGRLETLNRRLSDIDRYAARIADARIREAFRTGAGPIAVDTWIAEVLPTRRYDGLGAWIERHFEKSDRGWVIRDGSDAEIRAFLSQLRSILDELEKDDFDD